MKQSLDFDALGDKHKSLEKIQAGAKLVPNVPVIARLDGRAFHTFTKNARKPFDEALIVSMQNTTKSLVDCFHADLGYCQSDEITLVWKNLDLFDLKIQKMCSILASHASAMFNREITSSDFDMPKEILPIFDCRIWQVSDLETAAENLMWRQWDAYKNSISMAAHAKFGHSKLHGVNTRGKIQLLEQAGYNWHQLPSSHKRGTFYWKVSKLKEFTQQELERIPEKHRPTEPVYRSVIEEQDFGRLTSIKNRAGVLFNNEKPAYFTCDEVKSTCYHCGTSGCVKGK